MKMKMTVVLLVMFLGFTAWAETSTIITPTASTGLILTLIPLLVPLAVACIKFLLPKVPKALLPILAPAIGAGIDAVASYATGHQSNLIAAALLGSAGVGLREIFDQVKQQVMPPKE
tara:strand:+ start:108 stop:458 length:351 start_codon:yes stop_codon:yes gene_type:complete